MDFQILVLKELKAINCTEHRTYKETIGIELEGARKELRKEPWKILRMEYEGPYGRNTQGIYRRNRKGIYGIGKKLGMK